MNEQTQKNGRLHFPDHLHDAHWTEKLKYRLGILLVRDLARKTDDESVPHFAKRLAIQAVKLRRFDKYFVDEEARQTARDYLGKALVDVILHTDAGTSGKPSTSGDEFFQHFGGALESGLKETSQRVFIFQFLIDNWEDADRKESKSELYKWVQSQPDIKAITPAESDTNFYGILTEIGWKPATIRR